MKTDENYKRLIALYNELSNRVSKVETKFEYGHKQNGRIIAELAKDVDEIKNPDVHYKIVRR